MMTTDYKYIEQLLDRYFECETTLEEEQILRLFFKSAELPVHLLPYRDMFVAQTQKEEMKTEIEVPVDVPINVVKPKIVSLNRRLRPLYKAAACVAVVLSIGQAAQMPYYQSEAEQQEQLARSLEQLQQIQKDKNAVAQSDTVLKLKIEN